MTKEHFVSNFQLLLTQLQELTNQYCFNQLSANYKFILEPSGWIADELVQLPNGRIVIFVIRSPISP